MNTGNAQQLVAQQLVAQLKATQHRIVFAESCTAGRIAATLGEIPGVSAVLTGSAVVYQEPTKCRWLGVEEAAIADHGVVSEAVSRQMAEGVLCKTPHATIAASVTGHLGPDTPLELDGVAWCAVAIRNSGLIFTSARKLELEQAPNDPSGQLRQRRIRETVDLVLEFCRAVLQSQQDEQ